MYQSQMMFSCHCIKKRLKWLWYIRMLTIYDKIVEDIIANCAHLFFDFLLLFLFDNSASSNQPSLESAQTQRQICHAIQSGRKETSNWVRYWYTIFLKILAALRRIFISLSLPSSAFSINRCITKFFCIFNSQLLWSISWHHILKVSSRRWFLQKSFHVFSLCRVRSIIRYTPLNQSSLERNHKEILR